MVAVCSGCNVYEFWGAVVVGFFGGWGYIGVHFLMLKLRLDDPLDATAVHAGGGEIKKTPAISLLIPCSGLVGVLLVAFFDPTNGIFFSSEDGAFWASTPWASWQSARGVLHGEPINITKIACIHYE